MRAPKWALALGVGIVLVTALLCSGVISRRLQLDKKEAELVPVEEAESAKAADEEKKDKTAEQKTDQKQSEAVKERQPAEKTEEAEPTKNPVFAVERTEEDLFILSDPKLYTYQNLQADTAILKELYGDYFQWDSLGQTVDGRELIHFVIGDPESPKKIFINAGIHGREYITSQLLMKQTAIFLGHLSADDEYGDMSYQEMLAGKAIHVICMVNPDGISISQFGLSCIRKEEVRNRIAEIANLDNQILNNDYLRRWKANANGVDLNRNFDALWEEYEDPAGHPSADHYKGTEPGSEVESQALIKLTEREAFVCTISYHTQGQVIYWYFGQEDDLYDRTEAFAEHLSELTEYPMDSDYESLDPAGYKDWAIDKQGIPSLTIEVGTETSPVPPEQFDTIWKQNQYVWEETLLNLP